MTRKAKAFDLEISGQFGLYFLQANTHSGREWIAENVCFEAWQGDADTSITIEGTGNAQDITDGAFDEGLTIAVNGRKYIGNGRVAA